MNISLFKKKTPMVEKSVDYRLTTTLVVDEKGNLIDVSSKSYVDEIRSNASTNIIVSKLSSIVNEGTLQVKESSSKEDKITTNKAALQFVNWINFPNAIPSPTNARDIFNYLIRSYLLSDMGGMIITFSNGNISQAGFKNIRLAQKVKYNSSFIGMPIYQVQIDNKSSKDFKFDQNLLTFTAKDGNDLMILFVSGNFDIAKGRYVTPFNDVIEYIILQNYLVKFATSFHKNACFPSQIVQLTYKNIDPERELSPNEKKEFADAVRAVKSQLMQSKGADNAGKIIVPEHPSLEIKVTPLSIPTNAQDNVAYHNLATDKIFSFMDGGSAAAFEGKSEYSNNASAKLQDLYDGSFRFFNSIILGQMNTFMRKLLLLMKSGADANNIYLTMNTSSIKIYQKQEVNQIINLVQSNIITPNYASNKLSTIVDNYGDLTPAPNGDQLLNNIGGAKSTNPTRPSQA